MLFVPSLFKASSPTVKSMYIKIVRALDLLWVEDEPDYASTDMNNKNEGKETRIFSYRFHPSNGTNKTCKSSNNVNCFSTSLEVEIHDKRTKSVR